MKVQGFDPAEAEAKNAFVHFLHIEPVMRERDHAVLRCEIRPEHKNPYGMVHGGLLASLADNATGYAAHTDGRIYVTQNCSMNYVGNQQGGVITAESRVLHRGKSTCLCSVEIRGENDRLLLTGQYTLFCMGTPGQNKEGK